MSKDENFVKAPAEAVERYEKGDENAKADITENARGYTQLLAQYVSKERTAGRI